MTRRRRRAGAAARAVAASCAVALALAQPPGAAPARSRALDTPPPTPPPLALPIALAGWMPRSSVPTGRPPTATRTPTPPTPVPGVSATPTDPPTPTGSPSPTSPTPGGGPRPWPDTADGVHVFNDQIVGLGNLTEAQIRFAASRYVGTQKMTRRDADRLRALDPGFLVLHYRLGLGLGYRTADGDCQPTGGAIQIVDGDRWVEEWPGDDAVRRRWFFGWSGAERVYFCDFGWYLMDVGDADYRAWWTAEVTRQLAANDDDALFADSVSVPSYFGADHWRPHLPVVDAAFEADWSRRIDDWLAHVKAAFGDRYLLLPNAGSWVTTRDRTTYAAADGVMIEGFAMWAPGRRFDAGDWRLQMDRVLGLARQRKVVIAQAYPRGDGSPADVDDRLFVLASHLLVKGRHSYLNLETSPRVEWWPEYEVDLGPYLDEPPATVDALAERTDAAALPLYVRRYARGLVVVNPGDRPAVFDAGRPLWSVRPVGGGDVPGDGRTDGWRLEAVRMERVDVAGGMGVVLVEARP